LHNAYYKLSDINCQSEQEQQGNIQANRLENRLSKLKSYKPTKIARRENRL